MIKSETLTPAPTFLAMGVQPRLEVLYEDTSMIAINKPAGQLFHGYTKGFPGPVVDQVKASLKERFQKPGGVYLGVVHRLDRPVSGLVVFARNSKFAARLAEQFQNHQLTKTYLAIVEGIPSHHEAQLEDLLEFSREETPDIRTEKICTLAYRWLESRDGQSLLAIQLGTGRRNQIRRQLAKHGMPIVGDREHGAQTLVAGTEVLDPRFRPILLHSLSLQFQHPARFEPMRLHAPCPFYWQDAKRGWDVSSDQIESLLAKATR